MSISSPNGISTVSSSQVTDILLMSNRSIGGLIPNVTIEEDHTDSLTITKHPVQLGATIADHAYLNPQQLVMKVGWSDSSDITSELYSGTIFTEPINNVTDIYQAMLAIQASRLLIDVITGKRTYSNMLISKLQTTTNEDTENSLILVVTMEQVIIVPINAPSNTSQIGTVNNQASPQSTADPLSLGNVQPVSNVTQSLVNSIVSPIPGIP